MKMGYRTPNFKKSIKARTTGKMKRAVKKSVNPLYGKKGMGYINDPKKAVYNKIYNKTTIDGRPSSYGNPNNKNITDQSYNEDNTISSNTFPIERKKGTFYLGLALGFYLLFIAFMLFAINAMSKYSAARQAPLNYILPIVLFILGTLFMKIYKNINRKDDK